jgi:outer membrane receptor protein involved in Fe transport
MRHSLLFLFLLMGAYSFSIAQTVKGKVFDDGTGEPLTGATVRIERGDFMRSVQARLDGSYVFKNLQAGTYTIKISFTGYRESKAYEVTVGDAGEVLAPVVLLQNNNGQLREVVVTGMTGKETDRSARGLEKNANALENILSQNTIRQLPDVTVGSALQRVSGVTVQRTSTGEGRYAIIRGMDQRYNTTLINGIQLPSPDDKYRFVPMDMFPSDLLERLEVIKTLTPVMEGDAIGGTMNMVMKSAPDHFVLNVDVAAGYSFLFSNRPFSAFDHNGVNARSPAELHGNDYTATYKDFTTANLNYHNLSAPVNRQLGVTMGDRLLDNKLGILLSVTSQDFYRGSNSTFLVPNPQPLPGNLPFLSDVLSRRYSTQITRTGINNKIDYVFNGRNRISLYNFYLHQGEYETRYTADTVLGIQSTGGVTEVNEEHRSTVIRQNMYNGTLKGEHQLADAFHLTWTGVYSMAKRNEPDQASYQEENDVYANSQGGAPQIDSTALSMERRWRHNTDRDLSGYLDMVYTVPIAHREVEFSFGGMYRHKTRTNYDNDYDLVPFPLGVKQPFTTIGNAQFGFLNAQDGLGSYNTVSLNDYTATENIGAEYIQAKFNLLDKLQVLGGVRGEHTAEHYTTTAGVTVNGRSGTITYWDVLPDIHFKYALSDNQNIRLSYFEGISRPGFGDLVPTLVPGDYYNVSGNANLRHTTANNYDLRYELFPGGADQLLVGAFYKSIENPIEYFIESGTGSSQVVQPQNTSKATNYGLEAVATKYFGAFGFSVNYTYTHSRVTTGKLFYNADATTSIVEQTRPLQGQADNVGNISLLYKNGKLGLDMQLAFVYTGETISQVSPYYNLDYWQRANGQLAFSFEKRILKHLAFYGKVDNLTNAAHQLVLKYPYGKIQQSLPKQSIGKQTVVQNDLYRISFLAGFRYNF